MTTPNVVTVPTVIDYTSKDYSAFRQDMINNISTFLPNWTSRSPNDFGIVLIELFAYMGDILSFYGDRIASEAFLDTATQRQSVLNIAAMLGYQPTGNIAATTTLTFTTAPGSGSITIPAKTKVSTTPVPTMGAPTIIFETDQDLTIAGTTGTPNVFTGTVTATQGVTHGDLVTPLGISDGTPNQELIIPSSPVISGSIQVYVDEGGGPVQWTYTTSLGLVTSQSLSFNYYTDAVGVVHIIFGDNINGHIPSQGSNIYVIYRIGGGVIGNVGAYTGPGTGISTLVTPIANVLPPTNAANAVGGADAESTDSIRVNAPLSLQSVTRAVSLNDYVSLVTSVQGVQYVSAAASVYTNVVVYIAPNGGGYFGGSPVYSSAALKSAVNNFLIGKTMAGTTVTVADFTYVPVNITANVSVLPTYRQETVRQSAIAALKTLLSFNAVYPNERLSVSQIFQTLQQIPGVNYATLQLVVRNSAPQSGVQDIICLVNELPAEGTITVTADSGLLN